MAVNSFKWENRDEHIHKKLKEGTTMYDYESDDIISVDELMEGKRQIIADQH